MTQLGAMPTRSLWFALVLFVWDPPRTNGDRSRQREDSWKRSWWKKWGSPRSMFVNKVSPPAGTVPASDFSTAGQRPQQRHKNPLSELWWPDSFWASVSPKKHSSTTNVLCHMLLGKCFSWFLWVTSLYRAKIMRRRSVSKDWRPRFVFCVPHVRFSLKHFKVINIVVLVKCWKSRALTFLSRKTRRTYEICSPTS